LAQRWAFALEEPSREGGVSQRTIEGLSADARPSATAARPGDAFGAATLFGAIATADGAVGPNGAVSKTGRPAAGKSDGAESEREGAESTESARAKPTPVAAPAPRRTAAGAARSRGRGTKG